MFQRSVQLLVVRREERHVMKAGWLSVLSFVLAFTLAILDPYPGPAEATPPVSFPHGVASGDVTPFSAVLWTRVDRGNRLVGEGQDDDGTPMTKTYSRSRWPHVRTFAVRTSSAQ